MLVAAKDSQQARKIAFNRDNYKIEKAAWLSPGSSTCREVKIDKPGILLIQTLG